MTVFVHSSAPDKRRRVADRLWADPTRNVATVTIKGGR
jgi:hypothetical protein